MATKRTKSNAHKKGKKTKKASKSSSMKSSSSSSSGGVEMPVYCVHERTKRVMIHGKKRIFTMKNGNKRAMMEGECKTCHKKVTQFVKM